MVVKKDQRGEFVREVTFDQDFGAVYKLKKGTRRQYERGYVDAKVKRGTPSGWWVIPSSTLNIGAMMLLMVVSYVLQWILQTNVLVNLWKFWK